MRRASRFSYGFRVAALGLVTVVAATALTATSADAKKRGKSAKSSHRAKVVRYTPPYAAIVVDANSGKVLHEANADAPRHPASITKVMTLYLLFERLEAGQLTLRSGLPVSPHAAAQAPSKLGLKPGETIAVDDAIRALVTKSANDVAVVVAEALGEDEASFARLMTSKARALGMRNTVYRNASGLPNPEQITTARDQALLGRAIQDRFPKYYRYFSTASFTYKGRSMRNHNKLLGSMEGIDGIKTGYVNASGFNLLASLKRSHRHLVAVVMGGRSGGSRDARMRELLNGNLKLASTTRTAPVIVEAPDAAGSRVAMVAAPVPLPTPAPAAIAVSTQEPAVAASDDAPEQGDASPETTATAVEAGGEIEPIRVKTVKVKASMLPSIAIGSKHPAASEGQSLAAADTHKPTDDARQAATPVVVAKVTPPEAPATTPAVARTPGSDWMIQVGALESREQADERLAKARAKASKFLDKAKPFTEPIIKADVRLWRARFSGISKTEAEAACKTLKSAKIVCITLRN